MPLSSPIYPLQNMENFTLAQDVVGNILLEDGKGRCPFDPNFKSTALVVGECWGAVGRMGSLRLHVRAGRGAGWAPGLSWWVLPHQFPGGAATLGCPRVGFS